MTADHAERRLVPGGHAAALAPGIRTRLAASGHVLVDAPDGTIIDAGPTGFATLSMFAQPLALWAAMERLESAGNGATELVPTTG